jgi:CRISPR-associated endonuclease/helicase Cas3
MSDKDVLLQFWAKKTAKPAESRHPLLFHMLDVASVTHALWNHSLPPSIKQWVLDELGISEIDATACLSFWTGLHDIGKATPVFQRKSNQAEAALKQQGLPFPTHARETRHDVITAKVLPDILRGLGHGSTAESEEFVRAMSVAIGGHHGVFSTAAQRQNDISHRELGDSAWSDARRALAHKLCELVGPGKPIIGKNQPSHSFYMVLAGLTSVADWIGSNDNFFSYQPDSYSPDDYANLSRRQAEKALEQLGWATPRLGGSAAVFFQLFDHIEKMRPLQETVVSLAERQSQPSMVLIEAPMGEGKTEAALYLAHRWQVDTGKQGYYVALPTQATSNQMFARVRKALKKQYPENWVNLQLIHGASLLNEQFQQLRLASVGDGVSDGIMATEWFLSKKRGLLAPYGVGTIDQALLSVLQTRHFFVRLLGLCQKTVIVDEVHAYDTYMSELLERMFRWLAALGSPVILLSATLPAERRKSLFAAYSGQPVSLPDQTYPRVTWFSDGNVRSEGFEASRPFILRLRPTDDSLDDIVNDLRKAVSNGGHVAIICNTVGRAQKTYETLKKAGFLRDEEVQLLHARYTYAQRERREQLVLETFGKNGQRNSKAVLVSTQIIEQSLDLDFDLMITDLAPVDLVIQRAGRIHRHQDRQRPPSMAEPNLWVRMPKATEAGLPDFEETGYIYDKYVLLRSYLSLKGRNAIAIPQDIETMIEEVYGDSPYSWPSEQFKKEADRLRDESKRKRERECFKAKGNMVAGPDSGESPADYLSKFSKQLEEDEPELHRSLQALTRLAGPSVQVICLHRYGTDLFCYPHGDGSAIDLNAKPQPEDINNLLRQSLTITRADLVHEIIHGDSCRIPLSWKETAALRHHRLLVFEGGQCRVGSYLLTLDDELGLLVEKN